jgi:hypothetical protein
MNPTPQPGNSLRGAIENPTRGIVGLVDDLLAASGKSALRIEMRAGTCRVRSAVNGSVEAIDLPLRNCVFRAIVARVAALCNEQVPGSVSPDGGEARLSVKTNPPIALHVRLVKSSAEQALELRGI